MTFQMNEHDSLDLSRFEPDVVVVARYIAARRDEAWRNWRTSEISRAYLRAHAIVWRNAND